ncbi:MAG: HlyD family efflux transporter periplasmic adaptor subunit [Spirochaetales bacterium]|nr:HlyD family efflux transporter periplasmic adaptor subunit [Spirochaetales bacterium]
MKVKLLFILFFLIVYSSNAQYVGGNNRNGSGVFAIVNPGNPGRVVTVGGRLTPYMKIEHTIPVSGYINKININIGDYVKLNQPLFSISREIIGETFLPVIVNSRLNGIVSDIAIYENQEVAAGKLAITILDNTKYTLKTTISDRDAEDIRKLGPIGILGLNTNGIAFKGRIEHLSQEPDYSTGLFTLTMSFPYSDGLFLGMVLFVDIAVQKTEGISIEKSAIFKSNGSDSVWIIDKDNKLIPQNVIVKNAGGDFVIIVKGLKAGDKYIVKPSGEEETGMSTRELIKANLGNSTTVPGSN